MERYTPITGTRIVLQTIHSAGVLSMLAFFRCGRDIMHGLQMRTGSGGGGMGRWMLGAVIAVLAVVTNVLQWSREVLAWWYASVMKRGIGHKIITITALVILLVFAGVAVAGEQTGCCADPQILNSAQILNSSDNHSVSSEIDSALSDKIPVFVFFYAEWCHFCEEQKPVIDELEQEYADKIAFIRVNAEENPQAMKEFGVAGFPAMFLIVGKNEEGYVYQEFSGFTEKGVLKESFDYVVENGKLPEESECQRESGAPNHEDAVDMPVSYYNPSVSEQASKPPTGCCAQSIVYENKQDLGCGAGLCGARIKYDITQILTTCPGQICEGKRVTERVTTDWGCGAGAPMSWGIDCPIGPGNNIQGCSDIYRLCEPPGIFSAEDCVETYTQVLYIDNVAMQVCTITFNIFSSTSPGCYATVTRSCVPVLDPGICAECDKQDGRKCFSDIGGMYEGYYDFYCDDGACTPHVSDVHPCDDGDPCTDDFCLEGVGCQHLPCCDGSSSSSSGGGGGAGGAGAGSLGKDHPDENYDVSTPKITSNSTFNPETIPEVAVLFKGFPLSTQKLLASFNEPTVFVAAGFFPYGVNEYPVLIIPSGGLYGLDSLPSFKSNLEEYVKNGGTLVVFSQQHGYEYSALPGGAVSGYGWLEDQSCHYRSVGITTYHTVLSGQDSVTSDVNVDGYFTKYPENATILLSRTKNGMPAMLMYEYGNGTVIATTAYTDWAYGHYQATQDGINLVRDAIAWAKDPEEIPGYKTSDTINISVNVTNIHLPVSVEEYQQYELGDTVNIPINITNYANITSDKVSFLVFDPDDELNYANVSVDIAPNESKIVDFIYETTNASEKGIYSFFYTLYAGETVIIGGFGGIFALGLNISELSSYKVNFTLKDSNNKITKQENISVYVPPRETKIVNFTYANPSKLGIWNLEYETLDYNNTLMDSGTEKFAVSKYAENPEGWVYPGNDITFSVTTPEERYAYRSDVPFTVHIYNHKDVERNIKFTTHYRDLLHRYLLWKQNVEETLSVPASGEASATYTLHVDTPIHRQLNINALFYEDGIGLGHTVKVVRMFRPSVSVHVETDKKEYVKGADVSLLLNLTNKQSVSHNITVIVRAFDPDNKKIYEESFDASLSAYATENKTLNFTPPSDSKRGVYIVTADAYGKGNKIGSDSTYFKVLKDYIVKVGFDKPDKIYSARQNFIVYINATRFVEPPWNSILNISIPSLGLNNTMNVTVNPNETESFSFHFSIPENITPGKHDVIVDISYDNSTIQDCFFIPESKLQYSLEKTDYSAGENVSIKLENIGGADTNYIYSAILQGPYLSTVFEDSKSGVIEAGEMILFNHSIPDGAINGIHFLKLDVGNFRTNGKSSSIEWLFVRGLDALITSKTDKKFYSAGEDITVLTNTTKLDGEITGATLNLKILSRKSCVIPTDDLCINSDTTLCPGVYNIDDSDSNGVIIINASGVVVEGTHTVLNGAGSGYGIYNPGFDDVIVRDIEVKNYDRGIYLENSDKNTLIKNRASSNNKDGIYLSCSNNNTLIKNDASNNEDGILLHCSSSNTLTNNVANSNNYYGIHIADFSNNNLLANNTASNNYYGIYLVDCDRNTLSGNTMSANTYNFRGGGGEHAFFVQTIDTTNTIDGKPIHYLVGVSDLVIAASSNAGYVGVVDSVNVTVRDLTMTKNRHGVLFFNTSNSSVENVTTTSNEMGILILYSNNNTISNNNASSNEDGISLPYSINNTLTNNIANSNTWVGIGIADRSRDIYANNILIDNTASNNGIGIRLMGSNNTLTNNIANSNNEYGIYLGGYKRYNILVNNTACSNSVKDIYNSGKNSGTNNTCNETMDWNDEGTTGCTYLCTGISKSSTSSFVSTEHIFSNRPPVLGFTPNVTVNETDHVVVSPTETDPDNDTLVFTFTPSLNSTGMWQTSYGDAGIYTTTPTEMPNATQTEVPADIPTEAPIEVQTTPAPTQTPTIKDNNAVNISPGLISSIKERISLGISQILAPVWAAEGYNSPGTFTSSNSNSNNESHTIWEQNLTINVTDFANISTYVGELNVTGKLYLYATLYSNTGQIIAYDISTFYLTDKDLSLTLETDKRVYKPNESINIYGEVRNHGSTAESCNLSIKKDGDEIFSDAFILNPDETHEFATNTSSNTSFTLEGAVEDVTITDFISVESPSINVSVIAPDVAGITPFDVAVLIENTGNISADLNVSINSTWNITIPEGESRLLETTMSIKKNTTLNVTISGDVNRTIRKEIICGENAKINITPQPTYLEGTVEIPYVIENIGLLDSKFNVSFSIDGQTVSEKFFVPKGENTTDSVSFNLTKGAHLLRYVSPFEAINVTINVLSPPEFVVSSIYPEDMNFTLEENVVFVFELENTGGSEGEATLKLSMPDFEDTNRTWIRPGEKENISFNLTIPDDLEEKNYKGIYELNGKRSEFTFFVQGANISVDASLDKNLYEEGETAVLTLNVDNECNIDLSLYSRVKFNEYDSVQNFTLPDSGSKTLTFNVPANFTGDNKMLYTVYMDTGRSLYINSMYVYEKKPDVPMRLYTDKDVYSMGDDVTIHIIDVTGTDVLNLTAPDFTYNDTISGPTTLEFTLPELRSGTYYIDHTFGNFSSAHPFDVIGYSARIIEADLDKEEYYDGDITKLRMNIEANRDVSGLLKTWIYDPENELIDEFEMNETLTEGENEIEISRTLSTNISGIHVIVYGFYADLGGHGLTPLASGAEYFDAEGAGIYISLTTGWNMISLPLQPANISASAVLQTIPNTAGNMLYRWNASKDEYDAVYGAMELELGKAYWIPITADGTWISSGTEIHGVQVGLTRGWNMIGVPCAADVSATAMTVTVGADTYNLADAANNGYIGGIFYSWNAADGEWDATVISDTAVLNPGMGYFANVNQECTVTYP